MENYKDISVYELNKLPPKASFKKDIKINLNGNWKFNFCQNVSEKISNFFENNFDDSMWENIVVPSNWQLQGYDFPHYLNFKYPPALDEKEIPKLYEEKISVGQYRREFDYIASKNKTIIYFGGVNPCFDLWINGKYVGYSENSFCPSEFDITDFLVEGKNQISVEVHRYCTGSYLEDQDMWRLSGIFRDVYIYERKISDIENFYLFSTHEKSNVSKAKLCGYVDVLSKNCQSVCVEIEELKTKTVVPYDGKRVHFSSQAIDVNLWSAESPYLYDVTISLIKKNGDILPLITKKFGFREIEIKNAVFYLNRQPIKLKGVNRHEFNPKTGHAVTVDRIEQDLLLLKKNNINAVRTSHYPNREEFYELASKIGLYVIDENNLETHGLREKIPASLLEWKENCINRMERMVERDKNETCVIIWSLGNESGIGDVFSSMKEKTLQIDNTRPIHYEGDAYMQVSDIMSDMYMTVGYLKRMVEGKPVVKQKYIKPTMMGVKHKAEKYNQFPYLLCEYAHGLGNAHGNLKEYWDIINSNKRMIGGFIWDFADQVIEQKIENGVIKYCHGGDFNDTPNDGMFVNNGLLNGKWEEKPAMNEVRFVYQNIETKTTEKNDEYVVYNNNYFLNLSNFECSYKVETKGETKLKGSLKIDCKPQESVKIKIENLQEFINSPYSYLTICFIDKNNEDNVVAYNQFELSKTKEKFKTNENISCDKINVIESDKNVEITSKTHKIVIDKTNATICHYSIGENQNIIKKPLAPMFYRAETQVDVAHNDMCKNIKKFNPLIKYKEQKGKEETKNYTIKSVDITNLKNKIVISFKMNSKKKKAPIEMSYTICSNGKIAVELSIKPKEEIARCGTMIELDGFSDIEWFGKGEFETYCDRKQAGNFGLYKNKLINMATEYTNPQENGNRSDVSYLKLSNEKFSLTVLPIFDKINYTALPYSHSLLENSTHMHQIESQNFTSLIIDGKQRGVGGDSPGVFEEIREHNKLKKGNKYTLSYSMLLEENL